MKTALRIRQFSLLFVFSVFARTVQAQIIPELVFQNPVLVSGTAGADSARYLFQNVGLNLDAVVTILSRSSGQVELSSIDTSGPGLGFMKSFQPVLGMSGTAPANTNWWMKFNMTFYEAGTSTKAMMSVFNVTGLDIDGDASTLFEWAQMDRISHIDSAIVNSLTFSQIASYGTEKDYKVTGIIANAPGIDTSALNVMATYTYENKDNFDFTIGATTTSLSTTAGMRLNSLWFKQFSWANLPLKLISFSAILNNLRVDLTWKTVSETNLSHFEIKKSRDGQNFSEAGIVFARGNETDITTYIFSDQIEPKQDGVLYYRLRSVDIDGKAQYSETRLIRTSKQTDNTVTILTYPNPATNEIRVTIPSTWQNKKVSYEVVNVNGQTAARIQSASAGQTETINMRQMAPGFYIVKVSCGTETAQQRIVKR